MKLQQLFTYMIKDLLDTREYMGVALSVTLAFVVCQWIYCCITGKKKEIWQMVSCQMLVFYVVMVLEIAFFSREPGSRDGIDLQLFSTWGKNAQAHAWVLENVLMFLPFGVLVPVCVPKLGTVPMTTLAAFICSAGLEYAQFLTQRGHCQVDDVVMNVLGAIIGSLVWKMWQWIRS